MSTTRSRRTSPRRSRRSSLAQSLPRLSEKRSNDGRALQLEISKVAQHDALSAEGVQTPKTVAAVGREAILDAGRVLDLPFITKHNRAGKGLGVRLFRARDALVEYVASEGFEPPVDGITLIQEYIEPPEPFITRVEFVGGRLLYAVRVDTSQGFELCPADACRVDDAFCPAGDTESPASVVQAMF